MVLAAVIGVLLEQFTSLEHALIPAILLGMMVAMFIPNTAGCRVRLPGPKPKLDGQGPAKEPNAQS